MALGRISLEEEESFGDADMVGRHPVPHRYHVYPPPAYFHAGLYILVLLKRALKYCCSQRSGFTKT